LTKEALNFLCGEREGFVVTGIKRELSDYLLVLVGKSVREIRDSGEDGNKISGVCGDGFRGARSMGWVEG